MVCLGKSPKDNYYFDNIEQAYQKCCQKSYGKGNEINNNYVERKYDLMFLNDSLHNNNNCYEKYQSFNG